MGIIIFYAVNKYTFIILFIHSGLCWVLLLCGFPLVVVQGLLIAVASLVAEPGL